MTVTRAGGALGIPGLYVTGDPGASDADAKDGTLKVRLGLGWAKSHSFTTGQCPVLKYNRGLMMSILHDKAHIAEAPIGCSAASTSSRRSWITRAPRR